MQAYLVEAFSQFAAPISQVFSWYQEENKTDLHMGVFWAGIGRFVCPSSLDSKFVRVERMLLWLRGRGRQ